MTGTDRIAVRDMGGGHRLEHRCYGQSDTPPLPCPPRIFRDTMDSLGRLHRDCPPPAEAAGTRGQAIAPAGNPPESDRVLTPLDLARGCVRTLRASGELRGHVLEPCAGAGLRGGFYRALLEEMHGADPFDEGEPPCPSRVSFCEIDAGLDFFAWDEPVRWVICNPPWSRSRFLGFVERAFSLAPNVAFLCPAERAWRNSVKERARASGHARRAMWDADWPEVWSRPKAQGGNGIVKPGFGLALVWWQRGYSGPIEQGGLASCKYLEVRDGG